MVRKMMKKHNSKKQSFSLNRLLKIERNKLKRAKKHKYILHMEEVQRIAFLKNKNAETLGGTV